MGVEELMRKRLEVLLGDAEMATSYLRAYGPHIDMTKVNHFKEARKKANSVSAAGRSLSEGGESEGDVDPTYQVQLKCPVCQTAGIECHELKSKSMSVSHDRFHVPRYAPVRGFKTMNFNMISVTVCPKCLFASPDKRDFITWSIQQKADVKSQLGPFVIEELKQKLEQRKAMLPGVSDYAKHFRHPRSATAAVDSYRLAVHRALIEATLDVPLSYYKAAMYHLKIAMFLRDTGKDDEPAIREALPLMMKAFGRNDSENPDFEYQLLHVLVAMHIRLKELEGAQSYLGVLERAKVEKLKAAAADPGLKIGAVEKFTEATKELWTSRLDPDLWKH
jgi:uncharacterized protein (DUF2225 family)